MSSSSLPEYLDTFLNQRDQEGPSRIAPGSVMTTDELSALVSSLKDRLGVTAKGGTAVNLLRLAGKKALNDPDLKGEARQLLNQDLTNVHLQFMHRGEAAKRHLSLASLLKDHGAVTAGAIVHEAECQSRESGPVALGVEVQRAIVEFRVDTIGTPNYSVTSVTGLGLA